MLSMINMIRLFALGRTANFARAYDIVNITFAYLFWTTLDYKGTGVISYGLYSRIPHGRTFANAAYDSVCLRHWEGGTAYELRIPAVLLSHSALTTLLKNRVDLTSVTTESAGITRPQEWEEKLWRDLLAAAPASELIESVKQVIAEKDRDGNPLRSRLLEMLAEKSGQIA